MSPSFIQMFEISKSGIMNRLLDLDVVSNNLANFNTNGFKQSRTNFQEFLVRAQNNMASVSAETTTGQSTLNQILDGVQILSTQGSFQQGVLKNTGRPMDIAISGDGFFGITLPDGQTAYTRNGEFSFDEAGSIVDGDGNLLLWEGAMPENPQDIEIDQSGVVTILEGEERVQVGTVPLFRFTNPTGLIRSGNNLWLESESSGAVQTGVPQDVGYGSIVSRTLESSNVDLSTQFSRMMILQRGFELSVRALQQSDQMMTQAVQMRQG
jgi:flagellar basal-body rod protein FlgG